MAGASNFSDILDELFPTGYEVTPGLNEVYELRLARLEAQALEADALIQRGAYFARVDGQPTRHFELCAGGPLEVSKSSSVRLKTFFQANQFKTGYATHGLFPYRGKFHPQMIKALINAMGVRPGEVVLDPMMGSGTVLIEASVMGIDAIGVDPNPLCQLMTRAKLAAMLAPVEAFEAAVATPLETFDAIERGRPAHREETIDAILHLAYYDALGYAERRKKKPARSLFGTVLGRYVGAIERFNRARTPHMKLGRGVPLQGDARALPVASRSVHGVIFSPPYSFAVDYLANDAEQLKRLHVDVEELRDRMIGLRSEGVDRVDAYFRDMEAVVEEVARVLCPGRRCCVIVGSNTRQLERLLGPDEAVGIEERMLDIGAAYGLMPVWRTTRQVTGVANSMRDEHILLFESTAKS